MKFLLGLFVWLLVFIFLTIPLAILSLVKLIVTVIYCRSSGNRDKIVALSPNDCIVSVDSTWKKSIVNVGFVLKVGGDIGVDRFRDHFAASFNIQSGGNEENKYEKFYSYLVTCGGYVFRGVSKEVNLSEQILEGTLAQGQSLEEFLVQWMLQGYQENKPCWEMIVVPIPSNSSNSPSTAIALKIHHGVCDGYSLLHIIDTLTSNKSPYLVKDFQDGFWTQFKQTLEAPLNLGRLGGLPPETNPFRVNLPPPPEKNHQWLYSFTSLPLEELKLLRRKNGGVHLVSVIWAIVTGAMRRFLIDENISEIPEFIKIGNTLPWPRHPAMGFSEKNADKICNHWVAGIFKIPLREPDPLRRLSQIEAEYTSYLATGLDKFTQRTMYPVIWTLPGSVLVSSFTSKDLGLAGGLTSLVGGNCYSLLNCPVKNIHPILAIHDNSPYQPLSCFTFSHSGKMELTMGANPLSIIKDKASLDKICKKLVHDEMQDFLYVTNNLPEK